MIYIFFQRGRLFDLASKDVNVTGNFIGRIKGKVEGVDSVLILWKWRLLGSVWLFETLWTEALQAPLSMEFSRQGYWSGYPFPSPGDLPDQGLNPGLLQYRWILTLLATRELLANFLYLWLVLEYVSLPKKIYITCFKKGTTSVHFNQIESLQMGIVSWMWPL